MGVLWSCLGAWPSFRQGWGWLGWMGRGAFWLLEPLGER